MLHVTMINSDEETFLENKIQPNNNIEKLKGVHVLKKLNVLFMANNTVKVARA